VGEEPTSFWVKYMIEINAKSIKEIIGPGMRFQALPKRLKQFKVATLRKLKWIIENAELVKDNMPDYGEKEDCG